MGTFSAWHWLVVLAIVLLLFGAKRIPELAKGLGSGIKNFKNALKEEEAPAATPAAEVKAEATATATPVQPTTTATAAPTSSTTTTAATASTQDAHKA